MALLDKAMISENLSVLGKHPITNKHIYTRLEMKEKNLTTISLLREFPFLQDVDVSNNRIQTLAPLSHLPFLIVLNAENNELKTLLDFDPPQCTMNHAWIDGAQAIGSMIHLVNLAKNSIRIMRDLSSHRYIQELILDRNKIEEINGISELVFLKYLSISHNRLKTTRGLTSNLPIEILNLSFNEITETDELPHLGRLLFVNLSNNRLSSLEDFGKCRMLQKLDVSYNRIKDLQEVDTLTKLRDLSDLNMAYCPLTMISFYRYRVLFRTQQVTILDKYPASVKERIKAKVIHGDYAHAMKDIFDSHLKGKEEFVDFLPPLGEHLENQAMRRNTAERQKVMRRSMDQCKSMANKAATEAILTAQIKVITEKFTNDLLTDMSKRYPMLFGKSCGRKPSRLLGRGSLILKPSSAPSS